MPFEKGFTLLEIAIVIIIIALLAMISLPVYQQFQPTLKLNAEARQLASDLRYAQQMAITEQISHLVVMDMINNSYAIVKSPDQTIQNHSFKGVYFDSIANLTSNTASFAPTGAAAESGAIILTNGEKSKTIEIKPSGYVKTF